MRLDLRLPTGLMFTVVALLLVGYGLLADRTIYARSLGVNVNLWWGLVLLAFGAVMLALARGASLTPPAATRRGSRFGRISSGLVFFPAAYAAAFVALTRLADVTAVGALGLLGLALVLGLFTLQYGSRARALLERARLMLRRRSHPRLVARARHEQRGLLELLAAAAAGATAGLAAGPGGAQAPAVPPLRGTP